MIDVANVRCEADGRLIQLAEVRCPGRRAGQPVEAIGGAAMIGKRVPAPLAGGVAGMATAARLC